jgi:hypothetical protein
MGITIAQRPVAASKHVINATRLKINSRQGTGPVKSCGLERVALPRVLPNPEKVNISTFVEI